MMLVSSMLGFLISERLMEAEPRPPLNITTRSSDFAPSPDATTTLRSLVPSGACRVGGAARQGGVELYKDSARVCQLRPIGAGALAGRLPRLGPPRPSCETWPAGRWRLMTADGAPRVRAYGE